MDVFELYRHVTDDYAEHTRSFIRVPDERISKARKRSFWIQRMARASFFGLPKTAVKEYRKSRGDNPLFAIFEGAKGEAAGRLFLEVIAQ